MAYQFKVHYTREEAQALLPDVQRWLEGLVRSHVELERWDERILGLMKSGNEVGGPAVNAWVRTLADIKELLLEFYNREIQVKDLSRGLVDFPAIIGGKEVFLCWEQGESGIEFWHDLDSGYAGREHL
jgi:hypothetical protein